MSRRPALTETEIEQAIKDYLAGVRVADIADALRVSRAAIYSHFQVRGVPRNGPYNQKTVGPRQRPTILPSVDASTSGTAWVQKAACLHLNPERFFPPKGGSTRGTKRICEGCPVRQACLEHALANRERYGIWGGLSPKERHKLARLEEAS